MRSTEIDAHPPLTVLLVYAQSSNWVLILTIVSAFASKLEKEVFSPTDDASPLRQVEFLRI